MKKIFYFVVLAASILVINNLIYSIYNLWQKHDLLTLAEKELVRQKQENQRLKSQLVFVESEEFVERAARDKLLLVKPGEQRVFIPEDLIEQVSSKAADIKEVGPNWKKWLKLFF